jgi:hypothetical protein
MAGVHCVATRYCRGGAAPKVPASTTPAPPDKEPIMFKRRSIQATALCLATIVTVSILASMDLLATQQHAANTLARPGQTLRHVAIEAPRVPRS